MVPIIKSNSRVSKILSIIIVLLLLLSNPIQAAGIWSSLGSGLNNLVRALAVDSSGNLYAGGAFTNAGGNYIAKWDGNSWSALGSGLNDFVRALAVDSSGNLYAGGQFTDAGGDSANRIAKWNGSAWSALGSGLNNWVSALTVDGSGNLYAGGFFTTAGGVSASRVAKWSGSSWSALGSGLNSDVYALAVDSSGKLYAGGAFTNAGGNYIAKWSGSSWSALGSGMDNWVNALAVDSSGNLYAGGNFHDAGGVSASHVAKWDGSSWSALGSGLDNDVYALAVDGSGNLYTGGFFTNAGGVSAYRIAKWDGISWSALGSGLDDWASALTLDGSGYLYAGGAFTNAGGESASRIAKWFEDNTPPSIATTSPANGATITPTNSLLVTFSEDMTHDGGINAANNTNNFLLVESKGNGFQTAACNATDLVQDTRINIDSAIYENNSGLGPYQATLTVNHGVPLGSGEYKLFICGTTSVTDLVGNKINGGTDSAVNFTVKAAALPAVLPQTGFRPGLKTNLPPQSASDRYQQYNFVSLEIPSLGVEAPIVGVPVSQDGWDLTWLGDQAGWLHGTAFPSWAGNSAITAHVVDANGQPGLFKDLSNLKWGDEVIVHAYDQTYVYEVRTVEKYIHPGDTSSVFEHEVYPWLTLITCKGYDEASDSYNWRVVVKAVQTKIF